MPNPSTKFLFRGIRSASVQQMTAPTTTAFCYILWIFLFFFLNKSGIIYSLTRVHLIKNKIESM
jgi:hypothetical protein